MVTAFGIVMLAGLVVWAMTVLTVLASVLVADPDPLIGVALQGYIVGAALAIVGLVGAVTCSAL